MFSEWCCKPYPNIFFYLSYIFKNVFYGQIWQTIYSSWWYSYTIHLLSYETIYWLKNTSGDRYVKIKQEQTKKKLYVRGLLHIITLSLHNYIIINCILNVRYAYWSLRFCPITGLELKFLSFSLKVNILNNKWRECWESYKRG